MAMWMGRCDYTVRDGRNRGGDPAHPNDPERLFEHAQNVFYVGEIAHQRGDFKTAERYVREYKRLGNQMVSIAPDNMKWRMEVQYADADLGTVLYDQRRFVEAAAQFQEALDTMEAISKADPSNEDYRKNLRVPGMARRCGEAVGQIDAAIAARQRDVALLSSQFARTGDVDYRERLVPAQRTLGGLYAERGLSGAAIEQYRAAVAHAGALAGVEPSNTEWLKYGYSARFDLGRRLLLTNQQAEATAQIQNGCETVQNLLKRDARNSDWRGGLV